MTTMQDQSADTWDWSAWYEQKRIAFLDVARTWHQIARNCHIEQDVNGVVFAQRNALENEALAEDARIKSETHKKI